MIEGATLKAKLLGDGLEDAARKVSGSIKDIAESFEQLYYQSVRIGQSAEGIRARA
jgi:hypothetical protein